MILFQSGRLCYILGRLLKTVAQNNDQFLLQQFKKAALDRWLTPEQLLRSVDGNQDGTIDLLEFSEFLDSLNFKLEAQDSIRQLFRSFDHCGDGLIDLAEITSALGSVPLDLPAHEIQASGEGGGMHERQSSKFVSLVAHNDMKSVLINFIAGYKSFFAGLPLVTTGSTGRSLKNKLGIEVERLVASGPLGGDQAIGGMISEGQIAAIFFFKDPLTSHAHASDIEALTRLCDVHQIPYATNRASAEGLMMSLKAYGTDWELHHQDSDVVQSYKNKQQTVIDSYSNDVKP